MKSLAILTVLFLTVTPAVTAQLKPQSDRDTICGHKVHLDESGHILAWYQPSVPGAGYAHVVKLASEFIKSGTPVDPQTGVPLYLVTCCFQGPHMRSQEDFDSGLTGEHWAHNPACVYAGLVQSLVLDYMVYSGDMDYIHVVGQMLDYQLAHGTTPAGWPWPNVPYASSDPFRTEYQGATEWVEDGMRGDGLYGIEPDKVGELGIAYLNFFEVTLQEKYLEAAVNCADALAKHVREIPGDLGPFSATEIIQSPWPFRVNARTGEVLSEYTSNIVESVRLFDELLRISERINLGKEQVSSYQRARNIAWKWLYSKSGPMKTYIWNGYFEDIPNDPERANRVQITPMETARYLLKHPELDPDIDINVEALLGWVASAFSTEGMDAIREQTWCYEPMGSHTARYASICALYYERTGDEKYRDLAFRFFNLATYMTYENGVVVVGPNWPGSWFSDGYGDYIRHFMEGLAAVPGWAPAGENHLLNSTSVVQQITYDPKEIRFRTFDDTGSAVLRLVTKPEKVISGNKNLPEVKDMQQPGWTWEALDKGGILRMNYSGSPEIDLIL
jgi:hypothetical protein